MIASLTLRQRLLIASGLILCLIVVAPLRGLSASGAARGLLGLVALGGLGWWLWRRSPVGPRFTLPERLKIVSRAGLSQRCGIALVEADGRSFLVAFGDSFAEIHALRRRASSQPKGGSR